MNFDTEWQNLLTRVAADGEQREDRTGVGTRSLFGEKITVTNNHAFPATTLKKLGFEQVKAELACFIRGYTSLLDFQMMGCNIWNGNAKGKDDLGPIYGAQWRNWRGVDQLQTLIDGLERDPYSRRHVVSAWNVDEIPSMCLPPCHTFFQCYVSQEQYLDMQVYMRSVDLFIGLPFDVASFALLQRLIARKVMLQPGRLTMVFGDAHIYNNHSEQVLEILCRKPKRPPTLRIDDDDVDLFKFLPNQARLVEYNHHPFLRGELNV